MSKLSYVIGRHPVLEAIEANQAFDKIFISKSARGEVIDEIKKKCRKVDIHFQIVPEEKMRREFRDLNHQGVAALISAIPYYEVQEIIDQVLDKGELPFFIILDGVTDVRNMGAIARSALGLGAHGLIIPKQGSALIQADAIKVSAGALLKLPVCRAQSMVSCIKDLKLNGLSIAGIQAESNHFIDEIDGNIPIALVMGAEDKGITEGVKKEIDTFYKIPIQNLESYNVSVASALVMYQLKMNRAKNK